MNRDKKIVLSVLTVLAIPLVATSWAFALFALWSNDFTLLAILVFAPFIGLGVAYALYRLVTPSTASEEHRLGD